MAATVMLMFGAVGAIKSAASRYQIWKKDIHIPLLIKLLRLKAGSNILNCCSEVPSYIMVT